MVKLKGKVRIEFLDLDGQEMKPAIESENVIFNNTLLQILASQPTSVFAGNNAFIAIINDSSTPDPSNPNWTGQLDVGSIASGVTSPIWYETITPNFGEIQNRINAQTTPRTFYSVGLTTGAGVKLSRTLLTIPCTQDAFQVLNIYYQIQVTNTSGQRLSARFTRDYGGRLFGIKNCNHYVLGTSYCDVPTQSYLDIQQDQSLITTNAGVTRNWNSSSAINSHYKFKESALFQIQQSGVSGATDEFIGYIFNSILTGSSSAVGAGTNFLTPYTESASAAYRISRYKPRIVNFDPSKTVFQPPFQKIWTHRSGSTVPFFDASNAAIGNGYPVTSGTWAGRWPELYRFNIVTGGDIGTATYQFSKRLHLGFNGNTYSDRQVVCPFRNPNTPAAAGMHGWRSEDNDLLRWSNTQIVQYDQTGVTLLDLTNGNYQNWDATTSPGVPVTALRQAAVDPVNNLIYCACRNTGLWIINVSANTVTNISSAVCYGVDVGRGGVAFAIFEGSIRKSTDWSTALTFTYTGLTDNHWSRAFFLKVDPDPALSSDQIGIAIDAPNNPGNQRLIVWYNATTAIASTGPQSGTLPQWTASFDVSDTGSFWAYSTARCTFGSSSATALSGVTTQNVSHSVWGTVNLYKIAFYNNYLIAFSSIVNSSNVSQNSYTSLPSSATVLHMQGGIVVFTNALRQLFTDNSYCYENYGWNGSAWVLNNSGAKTIHSDVQSLIQGLQISWQRGASAPYFQTNDYYTQGILNGTWKDPATTVNYENFYYVRPVYFDVAVPSGVTIAGSYTLPAASDPTFFRIETDSIDSLAAFTINGVAVVTVYTTGAAPGPNEINVDGTGVVTFNSADAGKTFGGTYAWIGS